MDAKWFMRELKNDYTDEFPHKVEIAKLQALIEIREALDRLTEEVRAGRNRTI